MNKTFKITALGLVTILGVSGMSTTALAADGGSTTSKGDIIFETNTDPTGPKDPDTDKPINPTDPDTPTPTAGPLSIDYVSTLHFGTQKISGNNEVYYAELDKLEEIPSGTIVNKPNYIQITDNRGSNAGWKLTVVQDAQFKNGASELTGAILKLENPTMKSSKKTAGNTPTASAITLTPDGTTSSDAIVAQDQQGMGTWFDTFGADETAGATSISLTVPGDTAKVAGKYVTTLTWTLADTPD
ncbi:cell surface protein [Listeria floridensis FSL S10-1187]|uniref:Cell surface protein n=1 Tax=Listeria floridensis FSL S10-1187 TaxID=1265817 RepID=A0ABP3AV29_9LIST|nr:WxL domain-containing protein [Listeria floridensis]EUJ27203.1 cell surface protein [Listeria floridensis FSL S10-1187]